MCWFLALLIACQMRPAITFVDLLACVLRLWVIASVTSQSIPTPTAQSSDIAHGPDVVLGCQWSPSGVAQVSYFCRAGSFELGQTRPTNTTVFTFSFTTTGSSSCFDYSVLPGQNLTLAMTNDQPVSLRLDIGGYNFESATACPPRSTAPSRPVCMDINSPACRLSTLGAPCQAFTPGGYFGRVYSYVSVFPTTTLPTTITFQVSGLV